MIVQAAVALSVVKTLLAIVSLAQVKVTTLDGQTIEGESLQIDADRVAVVTADGAQAVPLADVLQVDHSATEVAEPSAAELQIRLHDGSQLAVQGLTASSEQLVAQSDALGELKIPRSRIRSVRLQAAQEKWQKEWDAYLQRTNDKDMVIVPKRDGSGLDFLSGVVVSLSEDTMPFLLDGDEIPVPRDRVFGVIFGSSSPPPTQAAATVDFQNGVQLAAQDVRVEQGRLQLTTSWGQQLSLPTESLSKIDFSQGRLHYLSDLQPLRETYFGLSVDNRWGPLFEQDRETRTGLSRMWKMSRDRFPNNGQPPLSLRGKSYQRGLCIFPSARIEYALDRKYSSLKTLVGVDDEVAFNQVDPSAPTAVQLKIEADGRTVFDQLVTATADPLPVELDLTGVNTLTLIVDFGDGSSVCDYLDLVNPTLLVKTEGN
ncbi:MAG: hypothetical protein Fues2KO_22590 [Fuerstiella sp.]